ncbi:MFS transporter [Nakamurella endophytica]|uniref:MFS transporter n=1 Tax=Nakamurella endophytica TaxID=1748367 RepID=A0A917SM29_9ACTN|nr:MFS transporter [Nakamurella endophytica]GGL86104.1 MFS transporter [Nakamurella endophytica]
MSDGLQTSRRAPAPLSREAVRAWRNAVFLIFALSGLAVATWLSRNPAIRDLLHASTAQMGWVVFGIAAGSIVGLTLSSHVLAVAGPRATILGCLLVLSGGLVFAGVGASVLTSMVWVIVGLAVFGAANGMLDVSMNVEGAANERALGRTVMPLFHASFSIGTMAGAGLGGLAERLHVPVLAHTAVIAGVLVLGALVAVPRLQPHPDAPAEPAEDADGHGVSGWRSRLAIWRDSRTVFIGLIVLGMAFAEGSANDWLALAMVDGHGVSNATGAFVFGVFVTAMTVGRIVGVTVLDRFGRVPVLRATAGLAAVGLTLLIVAPAPWLAVVGVVLWGLGASLGFPVGMSAAADDPATAAARVSAVATIGYCAFLVGPPLIGFVGEHVGLLRALLLVLVLVALAGLTSGAGREPGRTGRTPATPAD